MITARRPRTVDAHFWVAPGVEISEGLALPYPPPPWWTVMVVQPMEWLACLPHAPVVVHVAEFRRTNAADCGEVAHYELDSQPEPGHRWIVVNGALRAEKIR